MDQDELYADGSPKQRLSNEELDKASSKTEAVNDSVATDSGIPESLSLSASNSFSELSSESRKLLMAQKSQHSADFNTSSGKNSLKFSISNYDRMAASNSEASVTKSSNSHDNNPSKSGSGQKVSHSSSQSLGDTLDALISKSKSGSGQKVSHSSSQSLGDALISNGKSSHQSISSGIRGTHSGPVQSELELDVNSHNDHNQSELEVDPSPLSRSPSSHQTSQVSLSSKKSSHLSVAKSSDHRSHQDLTESKSNSRNTSSHITSLTTEQISGKQSESKQSFQQPSQSSVHGGKSVSLDSISFSSSSHSDSSDAYSGKLRSVTALETLDNDPTQKTQSGALKSSLSIPKIVSGQHASPRSPSSYQASQDSLTGKKSSHHLIGKSSDHESQQDLNESKIRSNSHHNNPSKSGSEQRVRFISSSQSLEDTPGGVISNKNSSHQSISSGIRNTHSGPVQSELELDVGSDNVLNQSELEVDPSPYSRSLSSHQTSQVSLSSKKSSHLSVAKSSDYRSHQDLTEFKSSSKSLSIQNSSHMSLSTGQKSEKRSHPNIANKISAYLSKQSLRQSSRSSVDGGNSASLVSNQSELELDASSHNSPIQSELEVNPHSRSPEPQQSSQVSLSGKKSSHLSVAKGSDHRRLQDLIESKSNSRNLSSHTSLTTEQMSGKQSEPTVAKEISAYSSKQSLRQPSRSSVHGGKSLSLNSTSFSSSAHSDSSKASSGKSGSLTALKSLDSIEGPIGVPLGALKSSLSIPKIVSGKLSSSQNIHHQSELEIIPVLQTLNCSLRDLAELSEKIVVVPNEPCVQKIKIARSRHSHKSLITTKAPPEERCISIQKSKSWKLGTVSSSKSSTSVKKSLSQKISALLTRRSSNSESLTKLPPLSEKDQSSKSKISTRQSKENSSKSNEDSIDSIADIVQTRSLNNTLPHSSGQTPKSSFVVEYYKHTGVPFQRTKSDPNSLVTTDSEVSDPIQNAHLSSSLSSVSSCKSKVCKHVKISDVPIEHIYISQQEVSDELSDDVSDELSDEASKIEYSEHDNHNVIASNPFQRPISHTELFTNASNFVKIEKLLQPGSNESFELDNSHNNVSQAGVQNETGLSLQSQEPQLNPPIQASSSNFYKWYANRSEVLQKIKIAQPDVHQPSANPPLRASVTNVDLWLADRRSHLDEIFKRVNNLESVSSAHLHRHQTNEKKNDEKFIRVLEIVRDQGIEIKNLKTKRNDQKLITSRLEEQSQYNTQSIHDIEFLVHDIYTHLNNLAQSCLTHGNLNEDIKDIGGTVCVIKKQLDSLRSTAVNRTRVSL